MPNQIANNKVIIKYFSKNKYQFFLLNLKHDAYLLKKLSIFAYVK